MKDTAAKSAELKMALKHDPVTPELREEAKRFPLEADEAYFEVVNGLDTAEIGSYVWVTAEAAGLDERAVRALGGDKR